MAKALVEYLLAQNLTISCAEAVLADRLRRRLQPYPVVRRFFRVVYVLIRKK